jgi:hypothetical protein
VKDSDRVITDDMTHAVASRLGRIPDGLIDALAIQVDLYLRITPGTQALSAWSMALGRAGRLDEMDRTWPLVRARLERAEFERVL